MLLPQQQEKGPPRRLRVAEGIIMKAQDRSSEATVRPRRCRRYLTKICRFSGRCPCKSDTQIRSRRHGETLTKDRRNTGAAARGDKAPGQANQSNQQAQKRNADQAGPTRHPSTGSWKVMRAVRGRQISPFQSFAHTEPVGPCRLDVGTHAWAPTPCVQSVAVNTTAVPSSTQEGPTNTCWHAS